jgi:hypothetical protein
METFSPKKNKKYKKSEKHNKNLNVVSRYNYAYLKHFKYTKSQNFQQ